MKREDGYKEVPNIKLIIHRDNEQIGSKQITFELQSLLSYEEEYNSEDLSCVNFTTQLLSPDLYIELTRAPADCYIITKEMLWRESDGEFNDYIVVSPPLVFDRLALTHKVTAEGEPTTWKFKLTGFQDEQQ